MSESKTSERRLAAAEKQLNALELRKAGASFQLIADKLGYGGPSGAYKAVESALLKTLQEPANEVRKLEVERLDGMWLALYPAMRSGDPSAIAQGLKIMERRAKLLGLDAPTKLAPTDPTGELPYAMTADEYALIRDEALRVEATILYGSD